MFYFEKKCTKLCLCATMCVEERPQRFPCAASEQSPHPTNITPIHLIHLLVFGLVSYVQPWQNLNCVGQGR